MVDFFKDSTEEEIAREKAAFLVKLKEMPDTADFFEFTYGIYSQIIFSDYNIAKAVAVKFGIIRVHGHTKINIENLKALMNFHEAFNTLCIDEKSGKIHASKSKPTGYIKELLQDDRSYANPASNRHSKQRNEYILAYYSQVNNEKYSFRKYMDEAYRHSGNKENFLSLFNEFKKLQADYLEKDKNNDAYNSSVRIPKLTKIENEIKKLTGTLLKKNPSSVR